MPCPRPTNDTTMQVVVVNISMPCPRPTNDTTMQVVVAVGSRKPGAVKQQWGWNENDEHDKKTRSEWHGNFCQSIHASSKEHVSVYL
jgi:hypothetical protein